MPTKDELKMLQALPLEVKIMKTQQRIREWVNHYGVDNVYVSFSGGKDSTVLLDIVRKMYPDVEAVFVNTGLEYPEIQRFAKSFDNVTVLRPEMRFDEVIRKYGYPFISKEVSECIWEGKKGLQSTKYQYRLAQLNGERKGKNGEKSKFNYTKYRPLLYVDFNISHYCCKVMKKKPVHNYGKESGKVPMTAQTAEESLLREKQWLINGCNGFNMKRPISNPMSFWTEQDILRYIKDNSLPLASVYGEVVELGENGQCCMEGCGKLCTTGCDRTGCIFCGFGSHLDKGESRFERLKRTHPRQYDYCMNGGDYDSDGLWKPNKNGLGMRHCIEVLNSIYGKDFIKY